MSTLPIRPDLGQLRRQARELLRAAATNDPSAVGRIGSVTGTVTLAGAQLAVAREHGFASWPALKAAVDDIRGTGVVPLLVGKHAHESITTPGGFLAWAGSQGWEPGTLPVGMIFTAERYITDWLDGQPERYRVSEELTPTNGRVFLTVDDPLVAIACLGIGASAVVAQVEHLVALGVGNFVAVGPAPSLSERLSSGECVVVDRALRDDGVSQHYLAPERYAYPDGDLTEVLVSVAERSGLLPIRGSTWTVPTPHRTTAKELETYRTEGVLVTEMATAALFAVTSALHARAASAVVVSRRLGTAAPSPQVRDPRRAMGRLLTAAIEAIRLCPPRQVVDTDRRP